MINLNDFMDEAADDQEDVKEEPVEGGGVTFQLNCDQCQFSSTDLANLTKHMAATNHFPNIDPFQVGPRFDCDSCKKEFRSKHGLAIHTAKSHVVRGGRKQRVSQASKEKGQVGRKQKPQNVKRSENNSDPLDALINQHMWMNQDIVRNVPDKEERLVANKNERLVAENKGRWEDTVPVPVRLPINATWI